MKKKFKMAFKLLFVWQDEKEEAWLREMAQKGWLLKRYILLGYIFEKAEAKDYIYKLDYKSTRNNDIDEYLAIFQDTGWEHVGQFMGWHYFRTLADECIVPEIYSDNHSKVEKYKGLLRTLSMVLAGTSLLAIGIVFNPTFNGGFFIGKLRIIYIVSILLFSYAVIRTYNKIKQLKEEL